MSTNIGVWVSAILMLALFSFMFKENEAFRLAEGIFVGIGAAHAIVMGYESVVSAFWVPFSKGQTMMLVPLILGMLLYTRYFPKWSWVSKVALAIPIGIGTGLALRSLVAAQVISQIRATMIPLTSINNIIMVVGVFTTVAYFLYTVKQTPVARGVGRVGIYFMMVAMGIAFATSIAANTSIYLGFLNTIMGDWLGLLPK